MYYTIVGKREGSRSNGGMRCLATRRNDAMPSIDDAAYYINTNYKMVNKYNYINKFFLIYTKSIKKKDLRF